VSIVVSVLSATLFLACAVLIFAPAPVAATEEMRFFRIGTASTAGNYFPVGTIVANAISSPPGSPACTDGGPCGVPGLIAIAQATGGAVDNLRLLHNETIDAALVPADLAYWAFTGTGFYRNDDPFTDLRAMTAIYAEAVHLVVRADAGIVRFEDLRGRTVSVGERGSGMSVDARLILGAYGLDNDQIHTSQLRPDQAADRLIGNEIDALFVIGGTPFGAILDLANQTDIRLLEITGPPAARLTAANSFFTELIIPDDVYPDVPATTTLGLAALLVTRANIDEAMVTAITAALWHPRNLKLFEGHPATRGRFTADRALEGISIPLHAGADRFYRRTESPGPPRSLSSPAPKGSDSRLPPIDTSDDPPSPIIVGPDNRMP